MPHGACVGTDVGDRWMVPRVEHLPTPHPLPVLPVISQSPRCEEAPGNGKAAVHQVHAKPTTSRVPVARGVLVAPFLVAPLPSAPAALRKPKLLPCALAQSQRLLGEAPCPGTLPKLGCSERFSREVLGSSCCQRAQGPSYLGLLAAGLAFLPASFPSQKPLFPALETLDWVKGL